MAECQLKSKYNDTMMTIHVIFTSFGAVAEVLVMFLLPARFERGVFLNVSAGVITFWLALALAISTISGFSATNKLFQFPVFTITVGMIICAMATVIVNTGNWNS